MLRRLPLLLVLLLLVACGGGRGAARDASNALTNQDRADLAFFAKIGFLDVKGHPFVEVRTGGWKEADGEVHVGTARGFLRAVRDDGTIEVLTGELFPAVWRPTEGDVPPEQVVSYRRVDLAKAAREALLGRKVSDDWFFDEVPDQRYGERFSRRARQGVLALACHRQGLDAEAHALLEAARTTSKGDSEERDDRPLREALGEDLSLSVIWRAVVAFGEAEIPRSELLRVFRAHLASFPESEHAERSAYVVEMLTRMVAEDEAHARDAKPWSEMTRAEQIDDLVFQLRDQNGHQFSQPGGPSVFALRDFGSVSPAHTLSEYGYDAAPALLDALDDRRFTRTVGFWRDFHYSHHIVRVGGAAAEVLGEITGKYFSREDGRSLTQAEEAKRWRQWWATFNQDGVDAGLTEAVRRGDSESAHAARQLVARDPKAALPVLLEGIANAGESNARSYLVGVLTQVPGEAQLEFMQKELRDRQGLFDRLRAARWLDRHGHSEGVETVQALWTSACAAEAPDSQVLVPVAICLVILGTEEAMGSLLAGLLELDATMRGRVLESVRSPRARPERWAPMAAAAERQLEEYLVASLEDQSELPVGDRTPRPPDSDTIRICEIAAGRLAYFWHDEGVRYDGRGFRGDRDRQIHAIRNHARAKQDLEPLPAPKPPDLPGMGNRVRRVEVLPAGHALGPLGALAVTGLQKIDITASTFSRLVDLAVRERPTGCPGVQAELWRPDDGTGIVVTLTFLDTASPTLPRRGSWDTRIVLRCGRATKLDESWGGRDPFGEESPRPPPAIAERESFLRELDRALARPFDLAIQARVTVSQQ